MSVVSLCSVGVSTLALSISKSTLNVLEYVLIKSSTLFLIVHVFFQPGLTILGNSAWKVSINWQVTMARSHVKVTEK